MEWALRQQVYAKRFAQETEIESYVIGGIKQDVKKRPNLKIQTIMEKRKKGTVLRKLNIP